MNDFICLYIIFIPMLIIFLLIVFPISKDLLLKLYYAAIIFTSILFKIVNISSIYINKST